MLNDSDLWPVTCTECGQVTQKQIGGLKHTVTIICDRCGNALEFHKEAFAAVLDNARNTTSNLMRTIRLTDKKR